jgi:hypothetical protein
MARFVIADISDAKCVLQELQAIVPDLPSVPVQPVIIASQDEPRMFDFFRRYRWFLPVHRYDTPAHAYGTQRSSDQARGGVSRDRCLTRISASTQSLPSAFPQGDTAQ